MSEQLDPAFRPPSPMSLRATGEGDKLDGAFARERSEWEKVPDRADEGLLTRVQILKI